VVLKRAVADRWARGLCLANLARRRAIGRAWFEEGDVPFTRVVPNGIDLADWPFPLSRRRHCRLMGRITPTKGPHLLHSPFRSSLAIPAQAFGTIENQT